jgi:hypothetical protein
MDSQLHSLQLHHERLVVWQECLVIVRQERVIVSQDRFHRAGVWRRRLPDLSGAGLDDKRRPLLGGAHRGLWQQRMPGPWVRRLHRLPEWLLIAELDGQCFFSIPLWRLTNQSSAMSTPVNVCSGRWCKP